MPATYSVGMTAAGVQSQVTAFHKFASKALAQSKVAVFRRPAGYCKGLGGPVFSLRRRSLNDGLDSLMYALFSRVASLENRVELYLHPTAHAVISTRLHSLYSGGSRMPIRRRQYQYTLQHEIPPCRPLFVASTTDCILLTQYTLDQSLSPSRSKPDSFKCLQTNVCPAPQPIPNFLLTSLQQLRRLSNSRYQSYH